VPARPGHEMATITDIRRSGPAMRRRTLVLDGDHWLDVPASVVRELALEVSDEVDPASLAERILTAERPLARERALRLLTARERSCAGLLERLVDDGFAVEVATDTVASLQRTGLVDDVRFSHALARTMANARGVGRAGIARELRKAGIEEGLADAALDEALDEDTEYEAALRLASAAAARPGATVDRVASRLARRGYRLPRAFAVARDAVAAATGASIDEGSSEPLDEG
jgi:regulatory protein